MLLAVIECQRPSFSTIECHASVNPIQPSATHLHLHIDPLVVQEGTGSLEPQVTPAKRTPKQKQTDAQKASFTHSYQRSRAPLHY